MRVSVKFRAVALSALMFLLLLGATAFQAQAQRRNNYWGAPPYGRAYGRTKIKRVYWAPAPRRNYVGWGRHYAPRRNFASVRVVRARPVYGGYYRPAYYGGYYEPYYVERRVLRSRARNYCRY